MIRLNLDSGPKALALGHGVEVDVLPMSTAIRLDAMADMPERDPDAGDDVKSEERIAFAKAIARRVIVGWRGVGDADGKPVEVTPAAIDALLDIWDLFNQFELTYILPGLVLADEGNVSAPLPDGSTAGAPTTAKPAKKSARTARKPRTARKR